MRALAAAALGLVACGGAPAPAPASASAPASAPASASASAPAPAPVSAPVCTLAQGLELIEMPRLDLQAPDVSKENLRAWIDLLSNPELHGRRAGSDENRRVADVLARALLTVGFSAPRGLEPCVPFDLGYLRDQNVVGHFFPTAHAGAPTILVGARYDAQGERDGKVYPGADDNASGVAALLEIARLSARKERGINIVAVAFGAEERGVLGARAYIEAPTVPLGLLSLMVNLDMVGRPLLDGSALRLVIPRADEALGYVIGKREDEQTKALLERAATREDRPIFGIPESMLTRLGFYSDSVPFGPYAPTIFLSTSDHPDYHQPTDTAEKIDLDQIARAVRLSLAILDEVGAMRSSQPKP